MNHFPKAYASFPSHSGAPEAESHVFKLSPSSSELFTHYPSVHIAPCLSRQAHESSLSEPALPAWLAPSPFGIPASKMSPLSRQSQKVTAILPLVPWLSTLQPSR